jgi:hypothetical protein
MESAGMGTRRTAKFDLFRELREAPDGAADFILYLCTINKFMNMRWIDTADIKQWANRRASQGTLPLLVRKLIRTTVNDVKSIHFPSEENISIRGWDGILNTLEATEYIPNGLSLWEFGTNKDVKGKADDDYDKRTLKSLGFNPSEVTYIFVTPRLWGNKETWIEEKKKDKSGKTYKS